MTQSNKNYSIEFFRFLFMLILAIWHFNEINIFTHGYLIVEFYFILSGFLLYKSLIKHQKGVLQYTYDKMKRFYPQYVIALLLMLILSITHQIINKSEDDYLNTIFKALTELFFIQEAGFFHGGFNYPTWYISVLLIGGGLIYSLTIYNKRLATNLILPIAIITIYTYFFNKNSSLEHWSKIGGLYEPLLRGIGGISIGVLLSHFSSIPTGKEIINQNHTVINILSISAVIFIFSILCSKHHYDQYVLIFFPFIILGCINSRTLLSKIFNDSFWQKFGAISYEMLLLHVPLIMILLQLIKYLNINIQKH